MAGGLKMILSMSVDTIQWKNCKSQQRQTLLFVIAKSALKTNNPTGRKPHFI
jgi:hypothetical protein